METVATHTNACFLLTYIDVIEKVYEIYYIFMYLYGSEKEAVHALGLNMAVHNNRIICHFFLLLCSGYGLCIYSRLPSP